MIGTEINSFPRSAWERTAVTLCVIFGAVQALLARRIVDDCPLYRR
jgi:hypothetical protein